MCPAILADYASGLPLLGHENVHGATGERCAGDNAWPLDPYWCTGDAIQRAFSRTTSSARLSARMSEKHRLAQLLIPGPFGKSYLADHLRFHPTATPHFRGADRLTIPGALCFRKIVERTTIAADLLKLGVEISAALASKPVPTFPTKSSCFPFINSHQKRAKILARSAWRRVAADDELLLTLEL